MRITLAYLWRNLTRNFLRTLLTIAAVALPVMIYVLSNGVIDGVERFLDNSAKQLRLAVVHKLSIINPLPEGHIPRIRALDPDGRRITSICGLQWIGGAVENDPRVLSTLAADEDSFVATFPEFKFSQAQIDAWNRDRRAIVIGNKTAGQFGWKEGQRITLRASLPPYTPMEFNIISIGHPDDPDPETNWCKRAYFQEEVKKAGFPTGQVGFLFIKCATKADLDALGPEIDNLFATSGDPTKTQDEKQFMNAFITQQFDLPKNLTILSLVTISVAVLASANTMSMNFRDRNNELATFKSLGFGGGFIARLVLAESIFLCLLGGLLGAAIPFVLFTYTPLKDWYVPLIRQLVIHPDVVMQALAISIGIGVAAAIVPAWMAARMKVVAALRSLE